VTTDTRARLLATAERLFAERGVDAVSLREISRESGAKNAIALQYHFDDRAGVVKAIVDKHLRDVDARRHAILDEYEADGTTGASRDARAPDPRVRQLAAALVRPLAAKLADADGGREFLQIYADLLNRPDPITATVEPGQPNGDSLARWRTMVEPLLAEDAARLHRRFTAILHSVIELSRRARSGPHTDDRLFTSYLIDVVTAILAAPVSDETRRLANERDRARRRPRPR
jgi:AcrR family transcriptional regulator